ncbi:MAG TPA: hypothetical protein VHR97_10295 [Candidatus Baltobacteraceae bacterium]|nr:hypothetical protein [Candidatus Baltobacteraceae bacterium]
MFKNNRRVLDEVFSPVSLDRPQDEAEPVVRTSGSQMPAAVTRRFALLALSAFGLGVSRSPAPRASAGGGQRLEVVLAIEPTGRPARAWLDAIRDRVSANELAQLAATARPLTADEQDWADMIGRVAPVWFAGVARLNAPFRSVTPPARPKVVLGRGGGDDAFGTPPDVMAFDLSALAAAYDDHAEAARKALMSRLLSHEYTHLLAVPFLNSIGWTEAWAGVRPYRRALRVLYNEGLGNMRSVEGDARWTVPSGQPTDRAREALARLTPVLAERLQALAADPAPDVAKNLLRNISQGPFAGKWGALPIALWLAADSGFQPDRIAHWVEAGPPGMLRLAAVYADPAYAAVFERLEAEPTVTAPERFVANRRTALPK